MMIVCTVQCTPWVIPSIVVFFRKFKLGCKLAAVSAQRRMELVKNALQNIMTERMPHPVHFLLLDLETISGANRGYEETSPLQVQIHGT